MIRNPNAKELKYCIFNFFGLTVRIIQDGKSPLRSDYAYFPELKPAFRIIDELVDVLFIGTRFQNLGHHNFQHLKTFPCLHNPHLNVVHQELHCPLNQFGRLLKVSPCL